MTKRGRSRRSSTTLGGLMVLAAVLIVAVLLFGWPAVAQFLSEYLGVELPQTVPGVGEVQPQSDGSAPGEETSGSGSFYSVYFTEPINPWDESLATGGIEDYLIELINNAQSSIDAAMFEFNLPKVADALIAAHQRGVVVRIVYDDENTADDPQMGQVIAAGIPATPDQRSAFMHNKFYVIDRQYVWTGSTNVTINDVYRNNNNAALIRSSKLAENYTREFEEMFAGQFGPSSPSDTPNPIFELDGVRIENYFASEDVVMPRLVEVTQMAQQTIHFMAFSFTDDALANAMLERAQAGVQVTGIFEQRGADTEFSSCPPLLNAGLDVRLDGNPRTFHHKVIIVDSQIVAIGSFNFSNNAAESNDENLLIIFDAGLAAQYESEFNRRMQEAVMPVGGQCRAE